VAGNDIIYNAINRQLSCCPAHKAQVFPVGHLSSLNCQMSFVVQLKFQLACLIRVELGHQWYCSNGNGFFFLNK